MAHSIPQYDYSKDEKGIWNDETTFLDNADRKPGEPPLCIVKVFMTLSQKCTIRHYQERCTMDEVR